MMCISTRARLAMGSTTIRPLRPQMDRAFTLVELLVTIGVIVLLVGISFSLIGVATNQHHYALTESTFDKLDWALEEWELQAQRQLTWWNEGDDPALKDDADVHGDVPFDLVTTQILDTIMRVPSVQDILASLDEQIMYYQAGEYPHWLQDPYEQAQMDAQFVGAPAILDAWGVPIYATHPGRKWTEADNPPQAKPDPDGTIRTLNEHSYGQALQRRMLFVSAGPDQAFGYLMLPRSHPNFKPSLDNLYSYPPGPSGPGS